MEAFIDKQNRAIACEYIVYNMMRDYPQMSLEEYRRFAYPKEKGGWKYLHYAVAKGAARTYEEALGILAEMIANLEQALAFG